MPLTGTEMGLLGLVIGMAGVGSGKVWGSKGRVSEDTCLLKHQEHDKDHRKTAELFDEKLKPLADGIAEIKTILRSNGHGQ